MLIFQNTAIFELLLAGFISIALFNYFHRSLLDAIDRLFSTKSRIKATNDHYRAISKGLRKNKPRTPDAFEEAPVFKRRSERLYVKAMKAASVSARSRSALNDDAEPLPKLLDAESGKNEDVA